MKKTENKKLNIAIVCDAVTDCVAGSFISTLRFSEILTKRGHKVIFITGKSPKNPTDSCYKNIIKTYRFRSFLLPKSEGQLYLAFPRYKKVMEVLKDEQIDIMHVIIPTPLAIASIKAARTLNIKIVAHSHTQPENMTMHIPISFIQRPINYFFYKYLSWLYRKADVLIYPTEFARKLLHKLEKHKETCIISNGVDTNKFQAKETDKLYDKFNLPRDKKMLLYVGRLHPEKSVETLIKAVPVIAEGNSNVHVMIAGFGHLDTKLEELAKKLGVEKKLTFLGKVTDEELIMVYNACDIFVLPSLIELEGMAVLEAMSCGKPIIIANAKESASTYFVNRNGLLFNPLDHAHLASRALILLKDEELRKKMGMESLKNSKNYDINESVSRLEKVFYSLLKK